MKYFFSILFVFNVCIVFSQVHSFADSIDNCLQKATFYIDKNEKQFDSHFNLIVLDYIKRAYLFKSNLETEKRLTQKPKYDDEVKQFVYFKRIMNPKFVLKKNELDSLQGIVGLMIRAMYADKYPLSESYEHSIWEFSKYADRNLTHAALSLGWIIENHSELRLKSIDSLIKHQTKLLIELANIENYSSDSGLEALLGLISIKKGAEIKKEWITQIIKDQQNDGGWKLTNDSNESTFHPTLLAILVLSDYKNNGVRNATWFR